RRFRRLPAKTSPRLKGWARTACIHFNKRGSRKMFRSAAIAKVVRSWPPLRCSRKLPTRRTSKSQIPCPGIFAAAVLTSASGAPFIAPAREVQSEPAFTPDFSRQIGGSRGTTCHWFLPAEDRFGPGLGRLLSQCIFAHHARREDYDRSGTHRNGAGRMDRAADDPGRGTRS